MIELGDWIQVTDNWIENHTYQCLGFYKQPVRVEGIEISLDGLQISLLVSVTGDLNKPTEGQLGGETNIGDPDVTDYIIWDETPWDEGAWG